MPIVLNEGIPRRMRPRGLLLPAINTFDGAREGNANGWLDGVAFLPRLCSPTNIVALDPCANNFIELPAVSNCQPWVTQYPFNMVDTLSGKATSFTGSDLGQLLEQREEEMRSWAFAKALIGPIITANTHTLSTDAHNPSTPFGAAISLTRAIAVLERDLANSLHGAQGYIHVPPSILHQIHAAGWLDLDGDVWRLPSGTIVVSDAGYEGAPPPTGGGATATQFEAWLYASGPIEYQYFSWGLVGDNPNQYTNIRTNALERFMQSMGILIFDPCPVTAVLATYL